MKWKKLHKLNSIEEIKALLTEAGDTDKLEALEATIDNPVLAMMMLKLANIDPTNKNGELSATYIAKALWKLHTKAVAEAKADADAEFKEA